MSLTRFEQGHRHGAGPRAACLVALLLVAGCGPTEEAPASLPLNESPRSAASALETDNGLTVNGLSFNGLSFNGLSFNGLSFNGLSSGAFASWFQTKPELARMVMSYLVHCAVPAGQVRTYTEPGTGRTHRWSGGLGLAPAWAQGAPATVREQQVVSACLAAHANKYGQRVPISVLGRGADGLTIPVTHDELKQYEWRESCFFGNLFKGEGVFVGRDKSRLKSRESSSRACSVVASRDDKVARELEAAEDDSSGPDPAEDLELNRRRCAPLVYIGRCADHCVMDASKTFYAECTYGGIKYQPLTTRMDKRDLYRCGDGVCQPTEACGEKNNYLTCKADCGTCR
jgi:hypothetical protein